jgi:hypothetical protein
MDPVIMLWYAIVCGALAVFSPSLKRTVARAVFGILTGVVAAAAAPTALVSLRALLGGMGL